MANVGLPSHARQSAEGHEVCPHCRQRSGTIALLTSMVRYYMCEACGHRWQRPQPGASDQQPPPDGSDQQPQP
jgi:hypothetical protein